MIYDPSHPVHFSRFSIAFREEKKFLQVQDREKYASDLIEQGQERNGFDRSVNEISIFDPTNKSRFRFNGTNLIDAKNPRFHDFSLMTTFKAHQRLATLSSNIPLANGNVRCNTWAASLLLQRNGSQHTAKVTMTASPMAESFNSL